MKLTLETYEELIRGLQAAGYAFATFGDAIAGTTDGTFVLMRHDIDFDVSCAAEMAQVESRLGVAASYFFRLRAPTYNLLEPKTLAAIEEIASLGHPVAAHVDLALYGDPRDGVEEELTLATRLFQANTDIVSFHRPSANIIGNDSLLDGLDVAHTYESRFVTDIAYLSDSRGAWQSIPTAHDAFSARRPLHLLTHPLWWVEQGAEPLDKIASFLTRYRRDVIRALQATTVSFELESLIEDAIDQV